jgi:hypothetical protein
MPDTLTKADVLKAVAALPDDGITLEDVIERLLVVRKVQAGLAQQGQGVPHDEVVAAFKKPPAERYPRPAAHALPSRARFIAS